MTFYDTITYLKKKLRQFWPRSTEPYGLPLTPWFFHGCISHLFTFAYMQGDTIWMKHNITYCPHRLGRILEIKTYKIIEVTIFQTIWSWSIYLIEWLLAMFDWLFSIRRPLLYVDFPLTPGFAIMFVQVFTVYPRWRNGFGSLQQKEIQSLESTY